MRNVTYALLFALSFAFQAFAQEHYTEGPVWNVSTIRVKPGRLDDYLTALQREIKPFYEEAKRQGAVMDYKVFLKETKHNPDDWDVAIAVLYRNHAQLDGLTAKLEGVRDKVAGSKQAAIQANDRRGEYREVLSIESVQEITLK